MTAPREAAWRPGFFTGRRHAVLDTTDGLTFHGVRLVWSVCGRATVIAAETREPVRARLCDRCVLLAGPPDRPR